MHNYEPIADKDPDWDTSCPTSLVNVDEPRPLSEAAASPTSSATTTLQHRPRFPYATTRRLPMILSLPIAVGALLCTSFYCLYTSPLQSLPRVQSLRTSREHGAMTYRPGLGILSSLSWPIIPFSIASDSDRHSLQTDSTVAELESVWDGIETTDVFENDREHRRCPRYQDHDDDDDDDDDDSDDEGDGDYIGETIGDIDVYLDMDSEQQENQEEEEDKQAGSLDTLLDTIEDMAVNEVSALVELIGLAQEELQNNNNNNNNHFPGVLQGMEDSLTDSLLSDTQLAEEEQDVNSVDHDSVPGDVQEPAFLSLARRRHHHKVHSASRSGEVDKGVESGELNEPDEDERDHYPSHLGHGADDNEDTTISEDTDDKGEHDDEEVDHGGGDEHDHERGGGDGSSNSKDKNKPPHTKQKPKPKHNSHQDHNANLGGTGGNGPILLCSSRSCLPGLRDYILAKLSVQIHHVMSHLLNQQTLLYMMDSTAPQTKESLMAGQEDLVQQIEDQVIQDLKDWVNGVGRSNDTHKTLNKSRPVEHTKTTSTLPPTAPAATGTVSDPATGDHNDPAEDGEGVEDDVSTAEVTVNFLAGDDDEIYGGDDEDGFQMESLDLDDDEDDDDEDHEFDKSPALIKKKQQQQKQKQQQQQQQQKQQAHQQSAKGIHKSSSTLRLKKRDAATAGSIEGGRNNAGNNNNNNAHVYFLSADKALMRQEWSRWIAHWVHHAKLLILSHTLATRTVTEMNQIAVAGGNVVSQDQRHWAWNLDKALATVMVASEMLCGGPAQPKQVAEFLSTLSSPHSNGDPKQTQKSVDLTVNAQKCIEAWRADLEEVLKRTATIA